MTGIEIVLLAIGLAMDCFAVSITSGIFLRKIQWRPILIMAFSFGFFQAIMPLLGWIGGISFSYLIANIDHWIAFAILAFLGGRMVHESFKDDDCRQEFDPTKPKVILTMSIATSIDAMAVGVSFAFMGFTHFSTLCFPIFVIGLTSFLLSIAGLWIGVKFGCGFARKIKAELWGGLILLSIGTKILIEHLFFQ